MVQKAKKSAKGRKIGRNKNKPANKRYVAEARSVKNKARKVKAQKDFKARKQTT